LGFERNAFSSFSYHSATAAFIGDVADHIAYLCHLTGTVRHAAIGSDLDGGFGREQSPADLDTVADLQRLIELLQQRLQAMPYYFSCAFKMLQYCSLILNHSFLLICDLNTSSYPLSMLQINGLVS
jgi:hypothetical protein